MKFEDNQRSPTITHARSAHSLSDAFTSLLGETHSNHSRCHEFRLVWSQVIHLLKQWRCLPQGSQTPSRLQGDTGISTFITTANSVWRGARELFIFCPTLSSASFSYHTFHAPNLPSGLGARAFKNKKKKKKSKRNPQSWCRYSSGFFKIQDNPIWLFRKTTGRQNFLIMDMLYTSSLTNSHSQI